MQSRAVHQGAAIGADANLVQIDVENPGCNLRGRQLIGQVPCAINIDVEGIVDSPIASERVLRIKVWEELLGEQALLRLLFGIESRGSHFFSNVHHRKADRLSFHGYLFTFLEGHWRP